MTESNSVVSNTIKNAFEQFSSAFPQTRTEFDRCEDLMMPMRDGARLSTRIFYPCGEGPFPVILVRNPYTPVDNDAYMMQGFLLFLLYGYALVYQNVRGVFNSEGEWLPFENERNDSLDSVEWIAKQPFCNGKIGTYGGSYLGHVQWSIADIAPPELKTMYISIFGGDPYRLFYENGMFKQGLFTLWAMQMMDVKGKSELSQHSPETFEKALNTRPHINADTEVYGFECPWYRNWIMNPDANADYWQSGFWGEYAKIVSKAKVPVCFQTGWFDVFLPSAVETFAKLPEAIRQESRMLIGPWHHGNVTGGDLEYPNEGIFGPFQLRDALDWFDFKLQDMPYGEKCNGITAYSIQEGIWRHFENGRIQAPKNKLFFFRLDKGQKELSLHPAEHSDSTPFLYDPSNPVRSRGGNLLTEYNGGDGQPECSITQPSENWRDDVLSFVSLPLEEPLLISGSVKVRLYVSTDAEDTAFTAKLMEVSADGKARNIRDGITSLRYRGTPGCATQYRSGETALLDIDLTDIVWRLEAGMRLRVDISSSNYPAFHSHSNTALPWAEAATWKTARQTIFVGNETGSHIEVPHL